MWVEIVMCLILEVVIAPALQYDGGSLQKLLGKEKINRILHLASALPSHSPPPDLPTRRLTNTLLLPGLTEPYKAAKADVERNESDRPVDDTLMMIEMKTTGQPETTRTEATSTDSSEGVLQLDWFDRQNVEYPAVVNSEPSISAGVTWNVTGTSAMVAGQDVEDGTSAGPSVNTNVSPSSSPDASEVLDASRPYFRVDYNRTRYSRRTLGSTLNTLCTESADVCRTMCFDREKYRVSCPTTSPRPTTPRLDMTRLLHMLSSLVADYDTNLTDVMNITLHKKGYKHCEPTTSQTTTTTTVAPPTAPMFDYEPSDMTGKVIAKCYVCGMEELGIPHAAHCADPFAKDLLPPAMPDHIAETKRKGYRKYCNYMDMKPWYINGSGIWGRWSGGCAVRWVDLSGVYTQRVCRIRERPALGNHYVSKRLAKLEFALRKVEDGCMLSPMATLVPFSRGVSLYARLHVCVCSRNWCNDAQSVAGHQGLWAAMIALAAALR